MNCFHCGRTLETRERIGFRETCAGCDRPLHACLNCAFYDPGYNHHCRETQAERVVDKDRANFCDYFSPLAGDRRLAVSASDTQRKLDALFAKKR